MNGGYVGTILRVDLTHGQVTKEAMDETLVKRYVGGRGLATRLLYDIAPPLVDPFDPENPLVLTTGVLTGTLSPFSSRTNITTKSPLTGGICMGNLGGHFGPELKFAGYDAILVEGKAASLSYLAINDDQVEIRRDEQLIEMPTTDCEAYVRKAIDPKARILSIGPASERRVRTGNVYGEERFVGRGGTGAVFASKNLKAIGVRGTKTDTIPVFDETRFRQIVKEELRLFKENEFFQEWRQYGTSYIVTPMHLLGILGTRNYQAGTFESHQQIGGETLKEKYVVKKITCHRCPVACLNISEVKEGIYRGAHCRGPEYETIYAFGSDCGVSNLAAIIQADHLCTMYGMDTMSTGNSCAFAMELFERGILTREDTDGLELHFGNEAAMIELVHRIGRRQGIGDVLAEGVRRAAEKIGKGSERYAMHVKGMELAGYDPRGAKSQGLAYATSSRGGCHHTGYAEQELYDNTVDRFTEKGKAQWTVQNQNKGVAFDCTGICAFPTQLGVVNLETMAELLTCATGNEEFASREQLLKIGERCFNLERLYNLREGIGPDQDTLPSRFLTEPQKEGASAGQVVDLKTMLEEYYALRRWAPQGIPTSSLLEELGIPERAANGFSA